MIKNENYIISIMSGTSLDGIDIIYTRFNLDNYKDFEILYTATFPYQQDWKDVLSRLSEYSETELRVIDVSYCNLLSDIVNQFIIDNKIDHISFVSSHGHTALHQPEKRLTYQIGNLQEFSNSLGVKVICDFRVQDVLYGGQGAPLVPIGDRLMFSDYDYCLNLGGFANISFEQDNNRIAYDICPVNIVLNKLVSNYNLDYDNGGEIAKSGNFNIDVFKELNSLEYYSSSSPKSLGIEWVNEKINPILTTSNISLKDKLHTYVHHIAYQISKNLGSKNEKVLITGGGAYNSFLIEELKSYSNCKIIIPDDIIVEYKEALIFGLLGVLKDNDQINCLKSVTGAKMDHSSGKILIPEN